jgi:hypothetical protein
MAIDIDKLEDAPHLLDLLIQMEDVLDSLDTYVFENWLDGTIVEGPKVRRYWLDMTLLYPANKMPDPRAGLRLLKHGVRVDYSKASQQAEEEHRPLSSNEKRSDGPEATDSVWLVRVSIPRRLIAEINAGELDFYDDEVDAEDVQDAQDSGMNEDTATDADAQAGTDEAVSDGGADATLDPNAAPEGSPNA